MVKKIKRYSNKAGLTDKQEERIAELVSGPEGVRLATLFSQCKPGGVSVESFLEHISEERELLFVDGGKIVDLETVIDEGNYENIIVKTK